MFVPNQFAKSHQISDNMAIKFLVQVVPITYNIYLYFPFTNFRNFYVITTNHRTSF